MWQGLGADGWVVWVRVAEVVVRKNCRINVCLGKQSNLGSEANSHCENVPKGRGKQLKC